MRQSNSRGEVITHSFGGPWTAKKLEALRKYLGAYMNIMSTGHRAVRYETIYVDAFAGSGTYIPKRRKLRSELNDATEFALGSARIALSIERPFGRYIFVDTDKQKLLALEAFVRKETALASRVNYLAEDANSAIEAFVRSQEVES